MSLLYIIQESDRQIDDIRCGEEIALNCFISLMNFELIYSNFVSLKIYVVFVSKFLIT